MKISKLLNKKNYLFFLFFIFFSISSANEPVDIWNIDKSKAETIQEEEIDSEISNEISEQAISIYDLNNHFLATLVIVWRYLSIVLDTALDE